MINKKCILITGNKTKDSDGYVNHVTVSESTGCNIESKNK